MQLIIEIILFKVKHFQYLHIWTFLDAIASSSSWCCQSASGHSGPSWPSWPSWPSGHRWPTGHSWHSWHSWPSGAGLAHLEVLAYSSSSISNFSNSASIASTELCELVLISYESTKAASIGIFSLCLAFSTLRSTCTVAPVGTRWKWGAGGG